MKKKMPENQFNTTEEDTDEFVLDKPRFSHLI